MTKSSESFLEAIVSGTVGLVKDLFWYEPSRTLMEEDSTLDAVLDQDRGKEKRLHEGEFGGSM